MSQIRKDPLSNTWVIIAPERSARPSTLVVQPEVEKNRFCPFCESDEIKRPVPPFSICAAEFDKEGRWKTRILPNKYPALTPEPLLRQKELDGIYHMLEGVGGHEILVESPIHEETMATMSVEQIQAVLRNYQCKYGYWRKDPRISYVSVFKNHGKRAGASLRHPHSQLIATPLVPPRIAIELDESKEYYEMSNKCLLCETIKIEAKVKKRLIIENDTMIAYMPFAPRFPFETLIAPKRHNASYEEISQQEIKDLASIMSILFKKYDKLLHDPPYNYIIHTAPLRTPGLLYSHWHMEIILRLSQPAGFEWGSGVYINSVAPEEAAKDMKKVKV
jgi:UDPglucose--hexose-1-phosphate uridylyltransferase